MPGTRLRYELGPDRAGNPAAESLKIGYLKIDARVLQSREWRRVKAAHVLASPSLSFRRSIALRPIAIQMALNIGKPDKARDTTPVAV